MLCMVPVPYEINGGKNLGNMLLKLNFMESIIHYYHYIYIIHIFPIIYQSFAFSFFHIYCDFGIWNSQSINFNPLFLSNRKL